jgi:hypothetical protein
MKFLHLSDLHFDPINIGAATKQLYRKFEEYVSGKGIIVDEIFFTGDFRNANTQADPNTTAKCAVDFLRSISKYVGVSDDKHIHIVPGNHDLTRSNKEKLEEVYIKYDHDDGTFKGKTTDNVLCRDYLLGRFDFFEMCIENLNNSVWNNFKTGKIHRVKHFNNYSIVYLNTAIASGRGRTIDKGRLLIEHNDLYDILTEIEKKNIKNPIFVLSHYIIDDIESQECKKIKYFFNDFKFPIIWLCGDAHDTQYNNSYNVAYITAGNFVKGQGETSFFVGELTDNILTLEAHSYDNKNSGWQIQDVVTKRINETLPVDLRPHRKNTPIFDTENFSLSLEERLKSYAEWLYNTYNKIKFIDREFKHNELFVDLHITYKGKDKEFDLATKSEQENENKNIQKRYDSSHLLKTNDPCVLIGESGAGKTTMVRNLLLSTIHNHETIEYIPVFIELPKLAEEEISADKTEKYIFEKLCLKSFKLDITELCDESKSYQPKKLLLIFDGMDEVANIEQLDEIIKTIEQFLGAYKNAKLIFTSRPSCEKIRSTNTFYINGKEIRKYEIEELSDIERKEQIERIIIATSSKLDKDKFWLDLLEYEKDNPQMIDMTKNPLLLSIILGVYQDNSADDTTYGNFPKNKIELYDKAATIIQKRSHIKLLPNELQPIVEILLGRIAFTLYEETIKTNAIEKILMASIENNIAKELNLSQVISETLAKEFMKFINDRSIFVNNKFLHESFKEYFAAKYLFNYLFHIEGTHINVKRTVTEEKTFFETVNFLYSNQNSQAVIEMLLLIVDNKTHNDEGPINALLKIILNDSLKVNPKYKMLFKSVGQFNNHQENAATKLIISMFERTCENKVNPFDELFWYMSEYNLKDISDSQKNSVGLDNAYDFITKKYVYDLQKLFLAGICYELFCYFYCEHSSSKYKYELYERLYYDLNKNYDKMYSQWIKAPYSSFIEVDRNGDSPVTWGNLLYFDYYVNRFNGGEFKNTRLIKIHSDNNYFYSDGLVLYSNNKAILFHHVRRGDYSSEFKIPDTVEHIKSYAFSNCKKLTKIEIPNSVESIGRYAFLNCSELKEIIVPDTVKSIGDGAFEKCINLEKVKLPKSLLEIRKKTFLDCKKLNDVQIPDSVIAIEDFAFGKCDNLHNVKLPHSLRIIQQQRAFEGCKNVKFNIEKNPYFSSDGGIIFNTDKTSLIAYPSASGEVTIPKYVNRIDEYAFSGCSELQKVTILNSSEVCDTAFSNCTKLLYKNIIFTKQNVQEESTRSFSFEDFEEKFESKLTDDKIIEIKTGCVYDDEEKEDIILYLLKNEDKFILEDGCKTSYYLDKKFELNEEGVIKNIKAITDYYNIRIIPGNPSIKNSFFLALPVNPSENFEESFLRMVYCIGFLKNMKIFYV